MSVRDTSIDPRLLQSARDEFMKYGFIKADLKTICDNASEIENFSKFGNTKIKIKSYKFTIFTNR